jgi:hypothetical protein
MCILAIHGGGISIKITSTLSQVPRAGYMKDGKVRQVNQLCW